MLGSLSSANAISAALRMAWPAAPAFPLADSGKIRPTLKSPAPRLGIDSDAITPGATALLRDRSPEFSVPLHPAKHIAATSAAAIAIGRRHPLPTLPRSRGRVGRGRVARASARLYSKAMHRLSVAVSKYADYPARTRPTAHTKARRYHRCNYKSVTIF